MAGNKKEFYYKCTVHLQETAYLDSVIMDTHMLYLPYKGQIKSDWELEIQLDCSTLMISSNGIFNLNVNLRNRIKGYRTLSL